MKAREAELSESVATIEKLRGAGSRPKDERGARGNAEEQDRARGRPPYSLEAVAAEIATREQRLKDELVVSSTLRGRLMTHKMTCGRQGPKRWNLCPP